MLFRSEDNVVNQKVAQAMLARLGCEVTTVVDGAEAVAALEQGSYALVLMDCQMPVLDGYQATEEIRRREAARSLPRTPIVALTANAMAQDRERAVAVGMDAYLAKPIELDDLSAVLARFAPRA